MTGLQPAFLTPLLVCETVRIGGYSFPYEVQINIKDHEEAVSERCNSTAGKGKNCSGSTCIGGYTSFSCGDVPADETVTIQGYATAETREFLPLPVILSNRIAQRLSSIYSVNAIPGLLQGEKPRFLCVIPAISRSIFPQSLLR